jgi:hypothetical protein
MRSYWPICDLSGGDYIQGASGYWLLLIWWDADVNRFNTIAAVVYEGCCTFNIDWHPKGAKPWLTCMYDAAKLVDSVRRRKPCDSSSMSSLVWRPQPSAQLVCLLPEWSYALPPFQANQLTAYQTTIWRPVGLQSWPKSISAVCGRFMFLSRCRYSASFYPPDTSSHHLLPNPAVWLIT